MSWKPYLDLLMKGPVQRGGIFGRDASTWITSEGFSLPQDVICEFTKLLDENCACPPTGVCMDGDKFINATHPLDKGTCLIMTGPVNNGNPKKLYYGMPLKTGFVLACTDTHSENRGALTKNVKTVADYLCSLGY